MKYRFNAFYYQYAIQDFVFLSTYLNDAKQEVTVFEGLIEQQKFRCYYIPLKTFFTWTVVW